MVYVTITLYQRPSGWFWFKPTGDQPQMIWSTSVTDLADVAIRWVTDHYGPELGFPIKFYLSSI